MRHCGVKGVDWNLKSQALLEKQADGKDLEVLKIELKDGTIRQFYFDISPFYGRFKQTYPYRRHPKSLAAHLSQTS